MNVEERVQAVQALGFLPRQARFLMTVALHSGYYLRRHYMTFTGTQNGKNVQRFLEGLVTRRLAVRLTYRPDRGHVYHLHHWSLYRALGHEENRNRRHVEAALIARKLMLLDVVLSAPDAEWFATEADKVALFTERFHVPLEDFPRRTFVSRGANPQTTRYFIQKLPIALVGDPPVVHLVYLATDGGTVPFEWVLREHARLLSALPAWVVIVAHPSRVCAAPGWDSVFRRFVSEGSAVTGARVCDLERYFVARKAVEQNELARLSVADLQTFRATRLSFAEPRMEALFSRWVASGETRLDPSLLAGPVASEGAAGRPAAWAHLRAIRSLCGDVVSAGASRVALPGGVPSRCVRRSAILRGRTADAVVRTVDVPVAREGGATPPRGADRDRAPGGARRSGGVAPPSLVLCPSLL